LSTKTFNRGFSGLCKSHSISYNDPDPPFSNSGVTYGHIGWQDTFSGVQNPNWKAQIKTHSSATTPASGIRYLVRSLPFMSASVEAYAGSHATRDYIYRYFAVDGTPFEPLPVAIFRDLPDTLTVNRVTARAYSLYLEKAKSAISSFESGQDLAEIRQTIESVIHPFSSLRNHVLSYFPKVKKLKDRYKKVHDLKKALADSYLEWTFGWKPLTFDIADGIVGLSNSRLPLTPIESHATEYFSFLEGVYNSDLTNALYHAYGKVISKYSIRLKGMVNAYYRDGKPPGIAQELQLLPEDFAPTAWDILPYSFVIDYFLNIGNIVRAYSFPSAALVWTNESTLISSQSIVSFDRYTAGLDAQFPISLGYTRNHQVSCANFDVEARTFTREAIQSLVPPLVFSLPLSAKPWENIAALLAGGTRGLLPFY